MCWEPNEGPLQRREGEREVLLLLSHLSSPLFLIVWGIFILLLIAEPLYIAINSALAYQFSIFLSVHTIFLWLCWCLFVIVAVWVIFSYQLEKAQSHLSWGNLSIEDYPDQIGLWSCLEGSVGGILTVNGCRRASPLWVAPFLRPSDLGL